MKDDDLVFVQSLIDKELDKLYHDIESMEKQVATRRQRIDYLRNLFLDLEKDVFSVTLLPSVTDSLFVKLNV